VLTELSVNLTASLVWHMHSSRATAGMHSSSSMRREARTVCRSGLPILWVSGLHREPQYMGHKIVVSVLGCETLGWGQQ
jgi:hypothetical protein